MQWGVLAFPRRLYESIRKMKKLYTYVLLGMCGGVAVSCAPTTRSWNANNMVYDPITCRWVNLPFYDSSNDSSSSDYSSSETEDSGYELCRGCQGTGFSMFYGSRQPCSGCNGSGRARESSPVYNWGGCNFLIRH